MIGRSRNRRRQPRRGQPAVARRRWPDGAAHARAPAQLDEAADHDDADQDHALGDGREVRVDVRNVMSVRMSWQDDDGDDRAEDAAPAAGQADAAEDDRGHAQQRVRPRAPACRCPVLAVRPGRASAANRPGQRVGDDLRPADGDAAPERGQLVAADGVDRQAEPRAPERDPDQRPRRRAGRPPPWGSTRCRASR